MLAKPLKPLYRPKVYGDGVHGIRAGYYAGKLLIVTVSSPYYLLLYFKAFSRMVLIRVFGANIRATRGRALCER
jgi:hypothetical protein